MRRALLLAGVMLLATTPLHAYVSSGSVIGKRAWNKQQTANTTTATTDPSTDLGTTDPVGPVLTDGDVVGDDVGFIDVRKERKIKSTEASNPVPEPGTMAITSLGLLAAAALRKKRGPKAQNQDS